MKTAMAGFVIGLSAPWKGLHLIANNRAIRKMAILPLLLNFAILIAGFALMIPALVDWIPALANQCLVWLGFSSGFSFSLLFWLIIVIAWPVSLFTLFYFLVIFARFLAAPFFGLLAERTLIEIGVLKDQRFLLWSWLKMNTRLIGIALAKVILFSLIGLLLFFLSFVPGLGLFTGFGFLMMAAFDAADISFEAMQMSLKERLRFFRQHLPVFFGFALATGLVFFIPGLNFFLFPAAVVGAGDMVRQLIKNGVSEP